MPKRSAIPIEPRSRATLVRLYIGDKEELDRFHPKLHYTEVIRTLVRQHIKACHERLSREQPNDQPITELDLDSFPASGGLDTDDGEH